MRRLYLLFVSVWVVAAAYAQERTVSGSVSASEDGSLLPGVNVVLKGTTQGVPTDVNGAYTITVPGPEAVLVYSYTGRVSQEITVGDRTTINVQLVSATQEMKEVVVTAQGISRNKRAIGYSTQTVGGDQLVQSRETNVVNALNSKVAGVQIISSSGTPGASASMKIRGDNGFSGSSQPLFVVDGIQIDNAENASSQDQDGNVPFTQGVTNSNRAIDINPNDIESITVLKGPAAAALYGVRAGNGVVIITTKKGRMGQGKPNISFSQSFQVDQVNKLPELQKKYSQGTGGQYRGPETGQRLSWGALIDTLRFLPDASYEFDNRGRIVGQSQAPANASRVGAVDNPKDFFQNGYTSNSSISVSGGGTGVTYYASASHLNQSGIVPNTGYQRTSIRATTEFQMSSKFKLTTSANYVNSAAQRAQQGSNTSGIMLGLVRTPITFDNSGGYSDPVNDPRSYTYSDGSPRNYRGGIKNPIGAWYDNPYWVVNRNPYHDMTDRFIGYVSGSYSILPSLTLNAKYGLDAYTDSRFGGFDVNSSAYSAGRVYQEKITNKVQDITANLDFEKDLNENFNVRALIGTEFYDNKTSNTYVQGDNMAIPGLFSMSNTSSLLQISNQSFYARRSVFYDLTVGYQNKLFLNTAGRGESSTQLPKTNSLFFFPSVSGSYILSEDIGTKDGKFFNFIKLKSSYGLVGRDPGVNYGYKLTYGAPSWGDGYTNGVTFPFGGNSGYGPGLTAQGSQPSLPNLGLKPEFVQTIEVGTEISFIRDRLSADVTYYSNKTTNGIILAPIPSSSGYQYQLLNVGEMTNKGLEMILNATPVKAGDFRWDVTVNYTRNRNKVTKLAPGVDQVFLNGFTGTGSYFVPGQASGVIVGGTWERDAQGRKIIGDDGYPILSEKQQVVGNPNPRFLMGLRNSFTYKNLTLSFLLDWRVGGQMWNGTYGAMTTFGTAKLSENRGDSVVFDGVLANGEKNTKKVALDQAWYTGNGGGFGSNTADYVEDISWLRMREVTVGYSLPKSWLEGSRLGSVSVSVYARNLFLITGYRGIDPETSLTGTSRGFGLDYFNNPNTRSYGASLNVSF
ncbi:SusC/RagA family TonB-linked outer membrane protein [Nostoc sp. NIES-2111]